jgi:hypothetical protein
MYVPTMLKAAIGLHQCFRSMCALVTMYDSLSVADLHWSKSIIYDSEIKTGRGPTG